MSAIPSYGLSSLAVMYRRNANVSRFVKPDADAVADAEAEGSFAIVVRNGFACSSLLFVTVESVQGYSVVLSFVFGFGFLAALHLDDAF